MQENLTKEQKLPSGSQERVDKILSNIELFLLALLPILYAIVVWQYISSNGYPNSTLHIGSGVAFAVLSLSPAKTLAERCSNKKIQFGGMRTLLINLTFIFFLFLTYVAIAIFSMIIGEDYRFYKLLMLRGGQLLFEFDKL